MYATGEAKTWKTPRDHRLGNPSDVKAVNVGRCQTLSNFGVVVDWVFSYNDAPEGFSVPSLVLLRFFPQARPPFCHLNFRPDSLVLTLLPGSGSPSPRPDPIAPGSRHRGTSLGPSHVSSTARVADVLRSRGEGAGPRPTFSSDPSLEVRTSFPRRIPGRQPSLAPCECRYLSSGGPLTSERDP